MNRAPIRRIGALVAAGFLAASALANYSFGVSLGRTSWEGHVYGFVGVLAVAMNAVAPFYLSWAIAEKRRPTAAAVAVLWIVCILYSTTSALGFAAQNRESVVAGRQLSQDAYVDLRRELLDLEARRSAARGKDRAALEARIDSVRQRLSQARETAKPAVADAQSSFLSAATLGLIGPEAVRQALSALFALMVELGATLGLFAALSHPPSAPKEPLRWKPNA
jgi:hypothetical protein